MESIGEDVPVPEEDEASKPADEAKPADRKEAAKAAEAVAELEAAEAALAVEEVRNRTRLNNTNATAKNSTVGSRVVDAVTGLADVVMGKANKTLPDEIEVVEPVAPASADVEPVVEEA